jgi:hypothetical protein
LQLLAGSRKFAAMLRHHRVSEPQEGRGDERYRMGFGG